MKLATCIEFLQVVSNMPTFLMGHLNMRSTTLTGDSRANLGFSITGIISDLNISWARLGSGRKTLKTIRGPLDHLPIYR